MALGAILDHAQAVPRARLNDRVHIGRLAIEMHRDDRGGAPGGGSRSAASRAAGIERDSGRLDVDEQRLGAGELDRGDGRHRGMRDGQDVIAGADPSARSARTSASVPLADADAVAAADKGGEFAARSRRPRAQGCNAAVQHARDRGVDLAPVRSDSRPGDRSAESERRHRHQSQLEFARKKASERRVHPRAAPRGCHPVNAAEQRVIGVVVADIDPLALGRESGARSDRRHWPRRATRPTRRRLIARSPPRLKTWPLVRASAPPGGTRRRRRRHR